jgi:hypothetical protein
MARQTWLRTKIRRVALPLARFAVLLAVAAAVFGTPHLRTKYECRYPRHGYASCAIYGWCDYIGVQGKRVFIGEKCAHAVRLLPVDWDALSGM